MPAAPAPGSPPPQKPAHGRHLTELSRLAEKEQISRRTETSLLDDPKRCSSCNTRKPRGNFQGARLSVTLCQHLALTQSVSYTLSVLALWGANNSVLLCSALHSPFRTGTASRAAFGPLAALCACYHTCILLLLHSSLIHSPVTHQSRSHCTCC